MHGQRHGGDRATDLDQDAAQLDEAETGAAVRLGDREGEQAGVGELAPQLGVDPRSGRLDLLLALGLIEPTTGFNKYTWTPLGARKRDAYRGVRI